MSPGRARPPVAPANVEIREFADVGEARPVERVQRRAWGFRDLDVVPHRLMSVVARNGGSLLGAFEGERVVGFVFAYPGWREGRGVLCSHMLGVDPDRAGRGIGRRLKLEQRSHALRAGFDEISWTFDPLEARGAHLDLRRLGARGIDYWPDLYGSTSSALHAGVATDRLVVSWKLDDPDVVRRAERASLQGEPVVDLPSVNRVARVRGVAVCESVSRRRRAARLAFVVPADLAEWRHLRPGDLAHWQAALREGIPAYLRRGYRVVDFEIDAGAGLSAYVLERGAT